MKWIVLIVIWFSCGLFCAAAGTSAQCYVDIPAYDARGRQKPAEVISVANFNDDKRTNLLHATGKERVVVEGRAFISLGNSSGTLSSLN